MPQGQGPPARPLKPPARPLKPPARLSWFPPRPFKPPARTQGPPARAHWPQPSLRRLQPSLRSLYPCLKRPPFMPQGSKPCLRGFHLDFRGLSLGLGGQKLGLSQASSQVTVSASHRCIQLGLRLRAPGFSQALRTFARPWGSPASAHGYEFGALDRNPLVLVPLIS